MTSYIITGKNNAENEQMALSLCHDKTIDQFDITFITSEKDSLGIEVIKKMQERVFLMPLRGKDKAVIIPGADLLTIPAQNALLKLLEEPPAHTYIFLLTENLDSLLGTIRSRCQIIKTVTTTPVLNSEDAEMLMSTYLEWTKQNIGSALKTAEKMAKERDESIRILGSMLQQCRYNMLERIAAGSSPDKLPEHLKLTQTAIITLQKTNASARLTLEHLLLSLRV
jgi:hypothetical protein